MSKECFEERLVKIQEVSKRRSMPMRWFETCDSTNTIAQTLAETGWRGVVGAEYQHNGRGRMQRSWWSKPGENLLLSWIVDWECSIAELPLLTLYLAAELSETFGVHVKWPNDLLSAEGLKVGGILSTVANLGIERHTVIIGLGLNVNQVDFPAGVPGTSLRLLKGQVQNRIEVLDRVLNTFQQLQHSMGAHTLDLWRQRSITLGKVVEVAGQVGVATGIREDGALIVDGVPITSGDVNLVEM